MLWCSASWFIKTFGTLSFTSTTKSDIPTTLDDPYYAKNDKGENIVKADNPAGDAYFAYTDGDIYNGKVHTFDITDAGAKALFGVNTAAEAAGKYEIKRMGGLYIADALKSTPMIDNSQYTVSDIFAGTHYYQILDKETGQILFYKYAADIKQDTLTATTVTNDNTTIKFDGDDVKTSITWTGETSKANYYLTNYVISGGAKFDDVGSTSGQNALVQELELSIPVSVFKSNPTSMDSLSLAMLLNNFNVDNGAKATVAYKVGAKAYIGSNYYGTLVRALNAAKNDTAKNSIIAIPPASHSLTTKTYTNVIDEDCEIASGDTLYIPYDASKATTEMEKTKGGYGSIDPPSNSLMSQVTIAAGKKLSVSGTLNIPAVVSGGGGGQPRCGVVSGQHSEILMESGSQIVAKSGAKINCYGFISKVSGTPTVTLESGSTMINPLTVVEHRGGNDIRDMSTEKRAAPFNRFYIRSVTSKVVVKKGAQINAYYHFSITPDVASGTDLVLFGNSTSSFLQMTAANSSIEYTYNTTTQQNDISIYGDVTLNPIEISKGIGSFGVTISTAPVFLPLSHYWHLDFYPANGSNTSAVNSTKQDIKILPGGYVRIHEGVTANLKSLAIYERNDMDGLDTGYGAYPNDKDGTVIVDGTLIVNGGLGGTVQLGTCENATLKATSNSTIVQECSATDPSIEYTPRTHTANGIIITGDDAGNDPSTLKYITTSTNFNPNTLYKAWIVKENGVETFKGWYQSVITVSYNEGITPAQKDSPELSSPGFEISDDYKPTPTKDYYTFEKWYTDQSHTIEPTTVYNNTMLYANWTPNEYTDVNIVWVNDTDKVLSAQVPIVSYNVKTENILKTPTDPNLKFIGWFTSSDCNESSKIDGLSGEQLLNNTLNLTKDPTTNKYTIYGKWGTESYSITYNTQGHYSMITEYLGTYEQMMAGVNALPDPNTLKTEYAADPTKSHTFDRWLLNGVEITDSTVLKTTIDNMLESDPSVTDFTVVSEWTPKKYEITTNDAPSGSTPEKPSGINSLVATLYANDDTLSAINTYLFDAANGVLGAEAKKFNRDLTVTVAFEGWKHSDGTIIKDSITASHFDANNKLVLTASWIAKLSVTVTLDNAKDFKIDGSTYTNNAVAYITIGETHTITFTFSKTSNRTLKIGSRDTIEYNSNGPHDVGITFAESDTSITVKSVSGCIVEGTMITLADGTQKPVEELTKDDVVLVFNHSTGKIESGYIAMLDHLELERTLENVINLKFSNGEILRIVWYHGVFDVTLNEYVFIGEDNYRDYIGHEFYSTYYNGTEFVSEIVTMTDSYITEEFIKVYNPTTVWHMNYFASGILNVTAAPDVVSGHMNYFELDDNMKYDEEQMQADIEKYGLYTYEDFKDYLTEEEFNALPFAHLKVSVGKRLITWDGIIGIVEYIKNAALLE